MQVDVDDLVQDCSNSIANALELLQSCTEPLMWSDAFKMILLVTQGPISLTIFPSQFKFDENFIYI